MRKEILIDIKNKENIDNYSFSYDCGEMYYFLKEFSMEDFEQIKFEEDIESDGLNKKADLTKITSVDEIISCTSCFFPDEKGLYHVEGIGIKFSPFIKMIQSKDNFKGYDLIKPIEETLLNMKDFLEKEKSINLNRKIQLVEYYFGLFDIKLNHSNNIEYIRNNINKSESAEFDAWIKQARVNEKSIQKIESYNIKILKK